MKILFVSNFYPPHKIGGYEMLCQDVADALADRGHNITILTSTFGVGREIIEGHVHRLVRLESDIHFYKFRHSLLYPLIHHRNLSHLRRSITAIQPDMVFIWGMWFLSNHLAAEAEKLHSPRVVYYLANPWPIEPSAHKVYWDMPAEKRWRGILKGALRIPFRLLLRVEWHRVPLRFQHALCCSQALRDQLLAAGVPLHNAPVIYEGINLAPYLAQAERQKDRPRGETVSLVYVGALVQHKGVHTAIEAVAHLPPERRERTRLTILGAGHPQYEAYLRHLVAAHNLSGYISFQRPIPRSELPEFLGRFDGLLLPSLWEEPLALIMQEGLASGLVVIGSATGGTREIIHDGHNGLLFSAGDAAGLANHIDRLIAEPDLSRRLAENGQRTAIEKFGLSRMVDQLEAYLLDVQKAPMLTHPLQTADIGGSRGWDIA